MVKSPTHEEFTIDVDIAEPLGDTTLITGTIGKTTCKIQLEPRIDVTPGDTLPCRIDPQRVHLFDPSTGEAQYHSVDYTESDVESQQEVSIIK